MIKKIIFLVSIFSTILEAGEKKEIVLLDSITKEPVHYARITSNNKNITLSNLDGMFRINDKIIDTITIFCLGYNKYKIPTYNLNKNDTIYLSPLDEVLDEVVLYSITYLMEKVVSRLKIFFDNIPRDEFYFYRTNFLKNDTLTSFSEGFINLNRKKKKDRIYLLSNKKKELIKYPVESFSFNSIINTSYFLLPKLNKDLYSFDFKHLDTNKLKISFYSNEKGINKFKAIISGYIIIDKENYMILESQSYSLENQTEKKKKIELYSIKFNFFTKIDKKPNSNKYQLSYSKIVAEGKGFDRKDKKNYNYDVIYESQNIGEIKNKKLLRKKKRTNKKKDIFDYSEYNIKSNLWKLDSYIIKDKKQERNYKLLEEAIQNK